MTTVSPRTFRTIFLTSPATIIMAQSNGTLPRPTSPGSSLQHPLDLTRQSYRSHSRIVQPDSNSFPRRPHLCLLLYRRCLQKQPDKTPRVPALGLSVLIVRRSVKSWAAALNEHPERMSLMCVHLRGPSTGPTRKSTYARPIGGLARTQAEQRQSGLFLLLGLLPLDRFPRSRVSTRY